MTDLAQSQKDLLDELLQDQPVAAAKAGLSERTVRRIDSGELQPAGENRKS